MAKIKIQGNASGTGVVTLTAPNTNSDRTITLPDEDITLGGGVDGIVSTANATAITIDSSENVGIGTSSPNAKLQVYGAGNVNGGNIQIGGGTNGSPKWSMMTGAHYNEAKGVCLIAGYSNVQDNIVHIGGEPYEANPSTQLRFHTHTSNTHTTGGTERMRIDSAGRVTMPYQPACLVVGNGASYTTVDAASAPFTNIVHQTGGSNYNTSTFRFTCPVSGWYSVEYNILGQNYGDKEWLFQKNGAISGRAWTVDREQKSFITLYCSANDWLTIYCNNPDTSNFYQGNGGSTYSWASYRLIG